MFQKATGKNWKFLEKFGKFWKLLEKMEIIKKMEFF